MCADFVPNTVSLGICFIKKLHLIKVGEFAWYSIKISCFRCLVWKTKSW